MPKNRTHIGEIGQKGEKTSRLLPIADELPYLCARIDR